MYLLRNALFIDIQIYYTASVNKTISVQGCEFPVLRRISVFLDSISVTRVNHPNLILNLAKCLIRFMLCLYRCVADINKAFLRILIAVEDRDVLRFFWPEDLCNPNTRLIEYRWKAVLFGSSSPFILASVLNRLITTNSKTVY